MSISESLEQVIIEDAVCDRTESTQQNEPVEVPITPPIDCPSPDCSYWKGEHGEGGVCAYPEGCWWEIR
jgi:hypothetical protein